METTSLLEKGPSRAFFIFRYTFLDMKGTLSCEACGAVPAPHLPLRITTTVDTLMLSIPVHQWRVYRLLTKIGDTVLTVLGRIAFSACRMLGIIKLTDDAETAVSDRSRLLWLEAKKRAIPMEQLLFFGKPSDTFRVVTNGKEHFFKSLPFPSVDVDVLRMDDKVWFKRAMEKAGLPVPKSFGVSDMKGARKALKEVGVACVKPRTGSNGRHTYTYVKTEKDLQEALKSVKEICAFASVEEQLEGNLCRATCVGGSMIGFLESQYPTVVGDGASTIAELIEKTNAAKPDGVGDIVMNSSYAGQLKRRGQNLDSVLPEGTRFPISYRAGSAIGGSNREHGRNVHPSFIPIIEAAAKLTGLSIVGFDIIIPDPLKPESEQRWGFIEANSLPWIDLHASPFYGEPKDLSAAVWDQWASASLMR